MILLCAFALGGPRCGPEQFAGGCRLPGVLLSRLHVSGAGVAHDRHRRVGAQPAGRTGRLASLEVNIFGIWRRPGGGGVKIADSSGQFEAV
jgi:hypothetical protein